MRPSSTFTFRLQLLTTFTPASTFSSEDSSGAAPLVSPNADKNNTVDYCLPHCAGLETPSPSFSFTLQSTRSHLLPFFFEGGEAACWRYAAGIRTHGYRTRNKANRDDTCFGPMFCVYIQPIAVARSQIGAAPGVSSGSFDTASAVRHPLMLRR